MAYLGRPPQTWVLPVTRGCDRTFTVRRKTSNGSLTDWNAEVFIALDINKVSPAIIYATVEGPTAQFIIDVAVCNQVKNTTKWRIIMSEVIDDLGTKIETPLAVGTFERHDG